MAADTSIEAYHGHRSKSDIQREQIAALGITRQAATNARTRGYAKLRDHP